VHIGGEGWLRKLGLLNPCTQPLLPLVQSNRTSGNNLRPHRKLKTVDGGLQTGSRNEIMYISPSIHDSHEIPTAIGEPKCFRDQTTWLNYCGDIPACEFVRNQRWRHMTGSTSDTTHVSARVNDINKIPTVVALFSGSDNNTWLLCTIRRLTDVWIYEESQMAHINFRLPDAIFNSQLSHTSDSLRSSPVV